MGLFTLPHNFKTILDESWEEEALVEERENSWDVKILEEEGERKTLEQGGIKVICVGLSRCNTKRLLHLNCTFMKKDNDRIISFPLNFIFYQCKFDEVQS